MAEKPKVPSMTLFQRFAVLFASLALAVLIGCGGGGGSNSGPTGTAPNALTRQQVKDGFAQSIIALAQSGMGGGSVGTSGGNTGSMGGVPFVGAFIRQFVPGTGSWLTRDTTGGGTGSTNGSTTSGGGEPPELYFDEYLGLWVQWTESGNTFSTNLFEDQEKTKPAGSFVNTFTENGSFTSTFAITAGPFAGAQGVYETVVANDGESGETTYDNTWPTWGHDEGSASWNANGSSNWQHRSELPNDSWFESNGSFRANGSGSASGSDSRGYHYSFTYNPDGSGRGRVEGPDAGLPCTLEWNSSGVTKITWADGSVETYDPNEWFEEGGTSGGNTGSVGG
jgi:hypothetical protein